MSLKPGESSPAPWQFDGSNSIMDRDGRHVMATANVRPENVRRIVACVNLLEGCPDELIEQCTEQFRKWNAEHKGRIQ